MPKKLTTAEFIAIAKSVHGEKYDYSFTEYNGAYKKVKLVCSEHGIFEQIAHDHLKHRGCRFCANNVTLTTPEFISRAQKIHGPKYDYSKTNYYNTTTKICIICPFHGEFLQRAQSHLAGYGCGQCALVGRPQNTAKTTDEFIAEAIQIHGKKFKYNNVVYVNANRKILLECPLHGEFQQTPNKHLMGQGCPSCQHIISKPETEFLNYCHILPSQRQKYLRPYRIDGLSEYKIFEFLGDYWHGNPIKYKPTDINQISKQKFGTLYENTMKKFIELKARGYDIYYMWENDWNQWTRDKSGSFPIKKYQHGNIKPKYNSIPG
jgi:hypothetical protein